MDKRDIWADASGYINGKLGASLFLMDPKVVKAEVAGGTGIKLDAKADDKAEKPTVLAQISWEGIKGEMTVECLWGIVEFQREFQIVDGGPLHKEPFRWQLVSD